MDSFVPGNALEEQLLADGSLGLGTFSASEAVRRLRTQQRSDALDGRWKTPKLDSKPATVRVGAAVVGFASDWARSVCGACPRGPSLFLGLNRLERVENIRSIN